MTFEKTSVLTKQSLIGQVGASFLRMYLLENLHSEGTARFTLNQLKAEHAAAIANAIIEDVELVGKVEMKFPRGYMRGFGLPESILTDMRATFYRNFQISKPILLIANTGDDEDQSMKMITPIGTQELLAQTSLWISVACLGLGLSREDILMWESSLKGLTELNRHTFDRVVEYIILTRSHIEEEGQPLINALGGALPALLIPRDTDYFESIKENTRSRPSVWRKYFETVDKQRAPFLRKQTPSQTLLSEEDLKAAFAKVKESIREEIQPIVEAFILAPDGWNDEAKALASCEWNDVSALFTGLKREKTNLGRETQAFYENTSPELLSADDLDYLERLVKRSLSNADEEDKSFYDAHSQEFKTDRKLKSAWDKFIHGHPVEVEDFLEGILLCFERLFTSQGSANKHLRIALDRKSKNDLRDLNASAGLYFAFRYKGIQSLLGRKVTWDVGELFRYPELFASPKYVRKYSVAKHALQMKFTLELTSESDSGSIHKQSTQLIWKFNPNKVSSEMVADWTRLTKNPFISCFASRETQSAKGGGQSVDLGNVKTFVPTYDKDRGSFVPTAKGSKNLSKQWLKNLDEAYKNGLIDQGVQKQLKEKWESFSRSYVLAINGFEKEGIICSAIFEQATAYKDLLDALCRSAKGDKNRENLLRPILSIGSVQIRGGAPAEIIAPWHPLRLLAIGVKACRTAAFIHHFLSSFEVQFGDSGRLFFADVRQEFNHPFYPEVVIGWQENKPELLALSDTCIDYTLHELPNVEAAALDETSDNPAEGAACVVSLVDRYVSLQPHEKSNLSVVLYNCDSARLPHAVVDKIGKLREEEEDFHCHVVLRHRDSQRLRYLYERIIETSNTDPDGYSASEATRDFMARLRIGISADQAIVPPSIDGPPNDIVFLQDVIARHAKVEWFVENAFPVELTKLVPVHWSRRRPAAMDDMKSVVYLCSPGQSEEGWAYLTALTTFFKGDWDGNEKKRLLPARQLDFHELNMKQIFTETHNLGNWVVNFDELIDRRQLINQGVRVIRYKQFVTQGRNLVVSSNASLGLLKAMVHARIKHLNIGISEQEQNELTEKFIREANDISGDIVLRAAKRGRNASELMGIVLSRFLIRKEVENINGQPSVLGWYFLDDYAAWLGQREEQIADILMLCPTVTEDNKLRLLIIISEAKYVDYANYLAGASNSKNQLRDTVRRIQEALFGNPERIDRELWLGRLADLILDGVQFPASRNINLSDWRRAIREGTCELSVRGYSHVFVSGPSDSPDVTEFSLISDVSDSYQEVYGHEQVRSLLLNYYNDEDPTSLRFERHGLSKEDLKKYQTSTHSLELPNPCINLSGRMKAAIAESESVSSDHKLVSSPKIPVLIGDSGDEFNVTPQIAEGDVKETPTKLDNSKEARDPGFYEVSFWRYPKIGLFTNKESFVEVEDDSELSWLKSIESRTKQALNGFGLQAKLLESKLTPNGALLKFQGSSSLTLDQVLKKRIEFKTTYGLNLISVQPEIGSVSLMIERPNRTLVPLAKVWKLWEAAKDIDAAALPIAVREDDGQILFLAPQSRHAPHTLIAGSTGSGKSVLMQNIILSIAATNLPHEAKIILIDPKLGVDYFALESLPHIEDGIIDNQELALEKLRFLVEEMDSRYRLFKENKVSNLKAFNLKVAEEKRLPILWLIHDEFAEWMMIDEYKKEVSSIVSRLGVKARAAGIHLIFAAQRPDANVVPMQLRANLGNRLILKVDSEGTSEISLGQKGAEQLLGKGHLIAKLEGESGLKFGQVPFTSEETIATITGIIQNT